MAQFCYPVAAISLLLIADKVINLLKGNIHRLNMDIAYLKFFLRYP